MKKILNFQKNSKIRNILKIPQRLEKPPKSLKKIKKPKFKKQLLTDENVSQKTKKFKKVD